MTITEITKSHWKIFEHLESMKNEFLEKNSNKKEERKVLFHRSYYQFFLDIAQNNILTALGPEFMNESKYGYIPPNFWKGYPQNTCIEMIRQGFESLKSSWDSPIDFDKMLFSSAFEVMKSVIYDDIAGEEHEYSNSTIFLPME